MLTGNDFHGKFIYDSNGNIASYEKSNWDKFWTGSKLSDEQQQYIAEWNRDNQRYQDQFGLQNESFQFNKDLSNRQQALSEDAFNFNKDLSNRQQALSEESYYNSVLNQANQLKQLGINPASMGQSLSGLSMSGGSNVSASGGSNVNAGSVGSSGAPQRLQAKQSALEMLSMIASIASQTKQSSVLQQNADTAQYNAETERLNAETNARNADTSERRAESDILKNSAQTEYIKSQKEYQDLLNKDLNLSNEQLQALGMSRATIQSWSNISWATASAIGITTLFGNVSKSDKWKSDFEYKEEVKTAYKEVVESANAYEALAPKQKDVVDKFYEEHPNINRTGKDFPASNLLEWKRHGYTDDQIYCFLKKYYGV